MKRKAKPPELLPPLYTGSSTPKFDAQKCLKLLGFENRRTCPSNLGRGSSTPRFDALKCLKLLGFKTVELTLRPWAPIGKGRSDAKVGRFWSTTIACGSHPFAPPTFQ